DGVSPAEPAASLPASPAASSLVKKKAAGASEVRERAAAVRSRRLMKELKEIQRIQNSRPEPVFTIDPESELAGDLRDLHIPHILLHLVFPDNFPFAPPFMRFAASVVKGHGRVARSPPRPSCEFSRRRAEETFRSVVKTHDKYGWVTPK
ncbi:Uncharacterized protein OBRU01_18363, partial [Operophtera brumata]